MLQICEQDAMKHDIEYFKDITACYIVNARHCVYVYFNPLAAAKILMCD